MAIAESVVSVKIIGAILILIFGALGCSTPVLAHYGSKRSVKVAHFLGFVQQLMLSLGAGVMLATALLHIVPEGIEGLAEGGLGGEEKPERPSESNETPTEMISPIGSAKPVAFSKISKHQQTDFTNFLTGDINTMDKEELRQALIAVVMRNPSSYDLIGVPPTQQSERDSKPVYAKLGEEEGEPEEEENEPYPYGYLFVFIGLAVTFVAESELHRLAGRTKAPTLKAHLVETGVAVHSVLVGVALGTMTDVEAANTLMIALIFHQLCEGFAVGPMIQKGATSATHSIVMITIFAFSTPLGVLVGALIDAYSDPNAKGMLLAKGILMLIASGLLIFVGCVEFLGSLQHDDVEHQAHEAEKVHRKKANRRREKRIVKAAEKSLKHLRGSSYQGTHDSTIIGEGDNLYNNSLTSTHSPREGPPLAATRASCCQQEHMAKAAAGLSDVSSSSSDSEGEDESSYVYSKRARSSFIETWGGANTTRNNKKKAESKHLAGETLTAGNPASMYQNAPPVIISERSHLLPASHGSIKSSANEALGSGNSAAGSPVSSKQKSEFSVLSDLQQQQDQVDLADEEDHRQINEMKKDFLSLHPLLTRLTTYFMFLVGGAIMSVIALWS